MGRGECDFNYCRLRARITGYIHDNSSLTGIISPSRSIAFLIYTILNFRSEFSFVHAKICKMAIIILIFIEKVRNY